MSKIIGEPKQHNGRWYQIVNVVDIVTDNNDLVCEELEFVKVKMKVDVILFRFWITIKSYKVNENNTLTIKNYTVRELQEPIFIDGELVYKEPTIMEKQAYTREQMKTLYPEVKRTHNPHGYYVDLSEKLLSVKNNMILDVKRQKKNGK